MCGLAHRERLDVVLLEQGAEPFRIGANVCLVFDRWRRGYMHQPSGRPCAGVARRVPSSGAAILRTLGIDTRLPTPARFEAGVVTNEVGVSGVVHLRGNGELMAAQQREVHFGLSWNVAEHLGQSSELATAQVDTLRIKLLKLAAVVTRNTRRILRSLPAFHPPTRVSPGTPHTAPPQAPRAGVPPVYRRRSPCTPRKRRRQSASAQHSPI